MSSLKVSFLSFIKFYCFSLSERARARAVACYNNIDGWLVVGSNVCNMWLRACLVVNINILNIFRFVCVCCVFFSCRESIWIFRCAVIRFDEFLINLKLQKSPTPTNKNSRAKWKSSRLLRVSTACADILAICLHMLWTVFVFQIESSQIYIHQFVGTGDKTNFFVRWRKN